MTTETQPQIKEFQSETKQVLRLVIHSLYSHKEIFLRELISNAADACEKLRFEALANPALMGADTLTVTLIPDTAAGTLTVKDNGIGMSRDEVIDNLGTIARSGTKKFLEGLSGDAAKDAQLIGQFGVGFYSAFIVADKVTVLSKRTGAEAVRWDSDGEGTYEIQEHDKADRGTEVILHLREDDKEFLEAARLRQLVRRYSDHLSVPIVLKTGDQEETLNQAKAFWTRPKAELKDEDYQAFYKHLTHDPGTGARLGAQQGRGQPRVHLAPVFAQAGAVRSVRTRAARRGTALREARVHHGQGGGAVAAVAAVHARAGRHGRPAAQRVARAAAEQSHRGEDQVRAGEAHARSARGTRRGEACGVRRVLEDVRRGPQGRGDRRCRTKGAGREAACAFIRPRLRAMRPKRRSRSTSRA